MQSIWICFCMALMEALLLCRLSSMVAYAAPKLETVLVREAADGSSLMAFILKRKNTS